MNPITRKEVFLAAAGGQDVTTPTPITREEVFLDAIAKGGGGSSLPSTETASAGDVLSLDDNKEPQWAAPSGSGGGVLVVHDVEGTLDKTWQEIHDCDFGVIKTGTDSDITYMPIITVYHDDEYGVGAYNTAGETPVTIYFIASSPSGYPAYSA